jgi:hypothetical protein
MNTLIQFKTAILPIFTALACLALSPTAQAQATCPSICDFFGENTAVGISALNSSTTGFDNTAIGHSALLSNTTGSNNTASGFAALNVNQTGNNNTASGWAALLSNSTGSNNTATGFSALDNNSADDNTATGSQALLKNTTGTSNTATGFNALLNNNSGSYNTSDGVDSLEFNTTGTGNTAVGVQALFSNTTGRNNTAEGNSALIKNTTGGNNIALGLSAGANLTTGSNNIDIGNAGVAAEAGKIRIGTVGKQTAAFIAGIHGVPITGTTVVVSASGQLGVAPSSERFKEAIKPMDKASEAILCLKPVTFRYKEELDPDHVPQFGLIAEEVEKVNPDLVVRDDEGKVYTVRYEAVNAMLLNEFLKEHQKVAEQQSTIAQLKATATKQQKQIEALTATVQKVGEQLELSRPALHLVTNHQ